MSKSICGFTVVLDKDVSEEYAQQIKAAMMQLKGVISVGQLEVDPMHYVGFSRARQEIGEKLFEIIYPRKQ